MKRTRISKPQEERHPALEYFLMNASDRINYRTERRMSIQYWYKSFVPDFIEKEYVQKRDITTALDLGNMAYQRISEDGYFGEYDDPVKGSPRVYKADRINDLILEKAYLIPVSDMIDYLYEDEWYMTRRYFDDHFKPYKNFLNQKQPFLTFSEAAKIANHMHQRRRMMTWPTVRDLAQNSPISDSETRMNYKIRNLSAEGKINPIFVADYRNIDIKRGRYRIPPWEAEEILREERRTVQAYEDGLTTRELADALGIKHASTIGGLIRAGTKLGLLHPIELEHSPTGGYKRYVLSREEADKLISGEIKLPSTTRYKKIIKNASGKELQKILEEEKKFSLAKGIGITPRDFAQKLEISEHKAKSRVRRLVEMGIVSSLSDLRSSNGRMIMYLLSPNDMELIADGKIEIPSYKEYQYWKVMSPHRNGKSLPPLKSIYSPIEKYLWRGVQNGDNESFNLILELYKPLISEIADEYKFGTTQKERTEFLHTGLFEILNGIKVRGTHRNSIIDELKEKLRKRIGEERPSWISIDRSRKAIEGRLIDLIDEHGYLIKSHKKGTNT